MDTLIRLTAVENPDLDEGKQGACYVDASRILFIARGVVEFTKRESVEKKRVAYDTLYRGAAKLSDQVGAYIPSMSDPIAVEWMSRARETSQMVSNAYQIWGQAFREEDRHPRLYCTEIQLACGTALEHGVMLTRVFVKETPEEVADLRRRAFQ